jgi:signal transduction histidine kinase
LWYLLSFTAILLLIAGFLYWQVQRNLLAQMDAGLELAAQQALVNVVAVDGRLTLQNLENNPQLNRVLSDNIGIFLLSPTGVRWQQLGQEDELPSWWPSGVPAGGWYTISNGDDRWRVYGQPVTAAPGGWLLVAQSLEPMVENLAVLALQLLWAVPLGLLLAGGGGYFLAGRALRPIDEITRTTQSIHAGDLNRRIGYTGPADEVGRLAQTLDLMLLRLQTAFARERQFTADAAHELRTPLTALKGRIGVTLSRPRQPAAYVETLQEMEQQVNRLIRLSNDLLFMARLEQGRFQVRREPVILAELVDATVAQLRPFATAKSINLLVDIPPDLTTQGNMDLLLRLLLNLLDNAVKYTPVNGRVTMTAAQQDKMIIIAMADTGPGILPEHLPHLFDRFYRVAEDRARSESDNGQGGAGLGLAIAYEIVRTHGGSLTVQSEWGKGTTFVIQLPAD